MIMAETDIKTPPRDLTSRAIGPDDPLPQVKNVVLVGAGVLVFAIAQRKRRQLIADSGQQTT